MKVITPADTGKANPYENAGLQNMPDMLLRPGGLEMTKQLIWLAKLKPGARILDLGCGFGGSAAFLSNLGFNVVGIDKSRALIKRGRELFPELRLFEGNAENIPLEGERFDAALLECSLSLMDVDSVLPEVSDILHPNGLLLISDVFYRTEEEYYRLLRPFGFEVTHFEDKTEFFGGFIAQLIMSTGSLDTLFDCEQWEEIKKSKPRYCLAVARKRNG